MAKVVQHVWSAESGWGSTPLTSALPDANLLLVFAGPSLARASSGLSELRAAYPAAVVLGCSTAGEIYDVTVRDETLVATAIAFRDTPLRGASIEIGGARDSFSAGAELAESLSGPGLRHLFVLSDGLKVNGTELVRGLTAGLPAGVGVTGGLAGDGAAFGETRIIWGLSGETVTSSPGQIAAIGFYGSALQIGYGSFGGWDAFGPERTITRSEGNVLYELDRRSALELYKTYLGEWANQLPASGLLFPLSITVDGGPPVVRTILGVDEAAQSITFAGDVPTGARARLMKANKDRLIDGATGAASSCMSVHGGNPDFAILISCVGRKLVLDQRIEEEVDAVRLLLGSQPALTGFYSYGEIAPFCPEAKCELHNQTMTITAFSEK